MKVWPKSFQSNGAETNQFFFHEGVFCLFWCLISNIWEFHFSSCQTNSFHQILSFTFIDFYWNLLDPYKDVTNLIWDDNWNSKVQKSLKNFHFFRFDSVIKSLTRVLPKMSLEENFKQVSYRIYYFLFSSEKIDWVETEMDERKFIPLVLFKKTASSLNSGATTRPILTTNPAAALTPLLLVTGQPTAHLAPTRTWWRWQK